MNSKGILIGEFDIKSKTETFSWLYNSGILVENKMNNTNYPNFEFIAYNNTKDIEKEVKKRKLSLFQNDNCIIKEYIKQHIFNHDYFLYRFIDGDLIIKPEKKFGDFSVIYKGLYYYKLKPILNEKELSIIKDIEIKHENIKQAEWLIKKQIQKYPKEAKYKERKRRIETALKEFEQIECHIHYYKEYLSIEKLLESGQTKCSKINDPKSKESKLNYLYYLSVRANKQYKTLQVYGQL
jgi:hypothetical protein